MTARSNTNATAPASPERAISGVMQRKCHCGSHTPAGGACPACSGRRFRGSPGATLRVGAAGDRFEREADRVSEQVMSRRPRDNGKPAGARPEPVPGISRLGAGPAIKLMDAIRGKTGSYVPDWETAEKLRKLADERGIPLQVEITSGLSTALTPLPFTGQGIRTAALSIPIRYHHTPVETADLRDAEQLATLLQYFLTA